MGELVPKRNRYELPTMILLAISVVILGVILSVLVAVVVYSQYLKTLPPPIFFVADSPQIVLEDTVSQDGTVHVTGTKCNMTNETLTMDGVSYLVRENPTRQRYLRGATYGAVRAPGCITSVFENELRLGIPDGEELLPGVYHFEGVHTIIHNNQRQVAPWYTESFTVTE